MKLTFHERANGYFNSYTCSLFKWVVFVHLNSINECLLLISHDNHNILNSFMKPSEPNRRKNRNTAGSSASNGTNLAPVVRKRKSPSPAPASVHPDLNNPDGQLPEFACKVCGRLVALFLRSMLKHDQHHLAYELTFHWVISSLARLWYRLRSQGLCLSKASTKLMYSFNIWVIWSQLTTHFNRYSTHLNTFYNINIHI